MTLRSNYGVGTFFNSTSKERAFAGSEVLINRSSFYLLFSVVVWQHNQTEKEHVVTREDIRLLIYSAPISMIMIYFPHISGD